MGYLYPGYYLPKDRAMRIDGLLSPKNNWTKEDVSKMIVDNTSSRAADIAAKMIAALDTTKYRGNFMLRETLEDFKKWKGTNELTDVGPTIFNRWLYFYLKDTFEDEMGKDDFKLLLSTHIVKQMIEAQTQNPNSPWWDNIKTKGKKETQRDILTQSYKEAIVSLVKQLGRVPYKWTWDSQHYVTFQHPIGKVKLFSKFFNVGPFSIAGSNEVINNQMFTYTDEDFINTKGGPSTRRIIDFSDIENSWSVLPTGQSGNPMSKHYDDQAKLFVNGKFRKMKLNKKEIQATSTKLIFLPK